MNFIEKWLLKRVAKKLIKTLPDVKEKVKNEGQKAIEEHFEELINKIEIAIVQFVEKYENNSK